MDSISENVQVFLVGAVLYSASELIFRGFTHWTMFIAGGLCLLFLYHLFAHYRHLSLWRKCLLGAIVITGIEFTVGCMVNLVLHWNVWDYSHYRWNLMGQVCMVFTILWFFLSAPLVWLTNQLHKTTRRPFTF